MARKYGKKNEIKLDPLKYNLCLIGEGGIGKTTLIKQYCEKLAGQDGYISLDVGKEDGSDAISGIVSEPVWDWEKFDDVTTDIIENRYTDYADLKVVVIDTFDELMNLAESEVLRLWNRDNPDKKTKFFKATYQGFNGPTDKAIEIVFDRLWALKRVGVSFITIGHTKKSDIADPVTGETYSILTTNMDKRYFNAMKNKVHFLGVCYIDRDIVKQKTGRKNIVTGKEEIKGKITSEKRVICFRDDNFSVDSKSRFADIIDRVPLDVNEFIKAITDAIQKEHDKSGESMEVTAKKQAAEAKAEEAVHKARIEKFTAEKQDEVDEPRRDEFISTIQAGFSTADADLKSQAKTMLNNAGYAKFSDPDLPIQTLKQIASLFTA